MTTHRHDVRLLVWIMIVAICIAVALLLLAVTRGFSAGGPWNHDAETSEWFKSLRNSIGVPCCEDNHAIHLDPDDYVRNDDGSYTVTVDGKKETVDAGRIIKGKNRVGYAILWRLPNGTTTCFMPGSDI